MKTIIVICILIFSMGVCFAQDDTRDGWAEVVQAENPFMPRYDCVGSDCEIPCYLKILKQNYIWQKCLETCIDNCDPDMWNCVVDCVVNESP